MRISVLVLALIVGGCTFERPPQVDPDAGPEADAALDAAPPCPECGMTYVFDSIQVPLNAQQSADLGFDLDGDGAVDNQIGNILSALSQAAGGSIDVQAANTRAVDRGDILLLASLQDCLPGLCLFTYHGAAPVPAPCLDPDAPETCRRHLDGTGSFSIEPPIDRFVPGSQAGSTYTSEAGTMVLELVIGGAAPVSVELVEARAILTGVSPSGVTGGKLGGAIPDVSVQAELIPAMHTAIIGTIVADCTGGAPPSCGCADGSAGETYVGIFDENDDCAVPLEEFRANSLVETLFRPDVDIDDDGTFDALSAGVGVTAVAATLRP